MECTDNETINDVLADDRSEPRLEFSRRFVGETDDTEVFRFDALPEEIRNSRSENSSLPLRRMIEISEGAREQYDLLTDPGPARICRPPAMGCMTAIRC